MLLERAILIILNSLLMSYTGIFMLPLWFKA